MSQQTREEGLVFPAALYEKIKVRPPPARKFSHHSHIIDEQWMRLENSKNYSPYESIKIAHQKSKLAGLTALVAGSSHSENSERVEAGEEKPIKDFREKLVDFLM